MGLFFFVFCFFLDMEQESEIQSQETHVETYAKECDWLWAICLWLIRSPRTDFNTERLKCATAQPTDRFSSWADSHLQWWSCPWQQQTDEETWCGMLLLLWTISTKGAHWHPVVRRQLSAKDLVVLHSSLQEHTCLYDNSWKSSWTTVCQYNDVEEWRLLNSPQSICSDQLRGGSI